MIEKCKNCGGRVVDGLLVYAVVAGVKEPAMAVCEDCFKGVKLGKLIIRHGHVGEYAYEQYSPLEMDETFSGH